MLDLMNTIRESQTSIYFHTALVCSRACSRAATGNGALRNIMQGITAGWMLDTLPVAWWKCHWLSMVSQVLVHVIGANSVRWY